MNLKAYFPYYKRLLNLAVPLVLTQVGQTVVQLVDSAMVGRVGTTELAAASFAGSVFIIIMILGIGIFLGITPIISNAFGSENKKEVAEIIKNSTFLSVLVTISLFVVSYSVSFLMPYMNQPPDVCRLAIPYYRILTVSLIPFLFFMLLKQIGEGLGNTLFAMIVTIGSNLINIFLNYILIFGKLGFPELGLNGAGYATLIARIIMPILLFGAYMYRKEIRQYFGLWKTVHIHADKFQKILKVGFPIAVQMVAEVASFAIASIMMGWLGDVSLASHQVAMGIASFTYMTVNGIAMAATIRVSFQLGNKDYKSMERVTSSAIHLVLAFMLTCGVLIYFFRNNLPCIFTVDPAVINQSASLLLFAAIFQVFDGLQTVSLGILRGFTDVKSPMLIATLSYLLIGLPISYLCAFVLGYNSEGIWMGFVAGLLVASILLSFRILYQIKIIKEK